MQLNDIEKLISQFVEDFAPWDLRLTANEITVGQVTLIQHRGWTIWLLVDNDSDGPFLDYYAGHRMTNDQHTRLRPDGSCESLPSYSDMRICSQDPEEDAELKRQFLAEHEEVARLLEEKKFCLPQEHPFWMQVRQIEIQEND